MSANYNLMPINLVPLRMRKRETFFHLFAKLFHFQSREEIAAAATFDDFFCFFLSMLS